MQYCRDVLVKRPHEPFKSYSRIYFFCCRKCNAAPIIEASSV
ncbi:TRASH domain-containing protein [Flammeovirga sp. EKP202]|nr:TRASH domain-containing protein [Flammeovirga sp. EKP202]